MEDDFQSDENGIKQDYKGYEDIEEGEDIDEIEDNNEIYKINKNQFNNQNIIQGKLSQNKGNYNISIKKNNNKNKKVNKKINPNSMNFYYLPQKGGISEPQNFYINSIPNSNFNNNQVFNENQNYYQNQMFTPNYNVFGQSSYFNNLNQSQNIYPNYSNPNQFNKYLLQENMKVQKELIELKNIIFQSQLLNNIQEEYTEFKANNALPFQKQKYKVPKGKIKNRNQIYDGNLERANQIIQKKKEDFIFSKKGYLEKEEIIIYMSNNEEFKEKLKKIKAVMFKDLQIPEITYEMIEKKITNIKYKMTKEDIELLKQYKNNLNLNNKLFYNKYMFYSQNKISLFTPHIFKSSKSIMSLFLPGELNISDFQYYDYHKNINNDVFLSLLKLRIDQFNKYKKGNEIITDEAYNDKIFGFNQNISGKNYYLYSIMDKEIISNKLEKYKIDQLFENLTGVESQTDEMGKSYYYETFNKNNNFLKGLSYEELILSIILDKIEDKYEILPRIMFYEYYLTLNGEKVVVSDKIESGYSEVDFVLYSKCNYIYEEEPLILQKKFNKIYNNLSYSNEKLEIKDNTLYFIELKSSFNFSGEEEEKKLSKYKDFFTKLFNKYKEFIHLYESKKWIEKNTKREIWLIYDNDIIEISSEIEEIINNLLKENQDCNEFKIIYTLKSYPYFPYSTATKKYKEVKEEIKKLKEEKEEMSEKIEKLKEEMSKKIEKLTEEKEEMSKKIEEMKKQLDNLIKQNREQINNKAENNEKKNEVSQNIESQNDEIKNNIINNNKTKNIKESNNNKNNDETKKDEN